MEEIKEEENIDEILAEFFKQDHVKSISVLEVDKKEFKLIKEMKK